MYLLEPLEKASERWHLSWVSCLHSPGSTGKRRAEEKTVCAQTGGEQSPGVHTAGGNVHSRWAHARPIGTHTAGGNAHGTAARQQHRRVLPQRTRRELPSDQPVKQTLHVLTHIWKLKSPN